MGCRMCKSDATSIGRQVVDCPSESPHVSLRKVEMASHPVESTELIAATNELVAYLRTRADDIGRLLAQRYREEIVEYRSMPDGFIEQDVAPTARKNLEAVLSGLTHHESERASHLEQFRDSAIRRFQQGVPMQALLHAYRLWGHTVWEEVLKAPQTQANPAAALVLAGRIMKHVDLVSTTVAQAYLQKATGVIHDWEMVRRDLVEALIAGNAPERVASHAPAFKLADDARYFVILLRPRPTSPIPEPGTMRVALDAIERRLVAASIPVPLAVIRGEEIVVICRPGDQAVDLRDSTSALAGHFPEFLIGIGRLHSTLTGIARSYVDAQDAILSAPLIADGKPRVYMFADALVEHVLRESAFRDDLVDEAVAPLRTYDKAHRSELVNTLRAYIDGGFNLAQAAVDLQVQPNTVKYRLQRIQALTGYNPMNPRDILLFALALQVKE